jgi:glycosyltransferase involved in cell wall biosynthesis
MAVGFGNYLADAVPEANVVVIPNGLDLEMWPELERAKARRSLGIPEHEFVLLFAGRIAHVKGVDILLDAVGLVASSLPDLSVYMIGPLSGSLDRADEYVHPFARSMLERAKGLPVKFVGFINNRELKFREYLAAADVFVLPSRLEPQGVVVLEALAMGTPVIGSATGGVPDMISSDVGSLFEPENATHLADRIRQAHERPEELRAMRAAARARVQLNYSWVTAADRYLAGFEQFSPEVQPNRAATTRA